MVILILQNAFIHGISSQLRLYGINKFFRTASSNKIMMCMIRDDHRFVMIIDYSVGAFLFCSFQSGPFAAGECHHVAVPRCQTEHRCKLFASCDQRLYVALVLS